MKREGAPKRSHSTPHRLSLSGLLSSRARLRFTGWSRVYRASGGSEFEKVKSESDVLIDQPMIYDENATGKPLGEMPGFQCGPFSAYR